MHALSSVTVLAAAALVSFAAPALDLKDPAILGEYTLVKPDKNSEITRAELIYNADNKLVVSVERSPGEYELTAPDKNGVVYEAEDEPNCDGDESACSYDSLTVIKLLSAKNSAGKTVPQLVIEITSTDAWNEDCGGYDENGDEQPECEGELTTYVLNWNKPLQYSIPFYTNYDNKPLEAQNEKCRKRLQDVVFEAAETAYLNASDICGSSSSFKYRDSFDVAFPYLLKDWLGGNEKQPKEITAKDVAALFGQAKTLAEGYHSPGVVTRAAILEEIGKLETYFLKFDRFFQVQPVSSDSDDAKIFAADTKTKVIVQVDFKIKR